MRVVKKHDVRLAEILDAAQALFISKGYEITTINDILEEVKIGKGTFYYYFSSKEDVMNAVILRSIRQMEIVIKGIAEMESLSAIQKLSQIIPAMSISQGYDGKLLEEIYKPNNALFHQKNIIQAIKIISPIIADIVRQGIKEGTFSTPYPQETVEFLLVGNQFIFDEGIFNWSKEELTQRGKGYIYNMEMILGTPKGTFDFVFANKI